MPKITMIYFFNKRIVLLSLFVLLSIRVAQGQPSQNKKGPLGTLTTVRQVHELPSEEAQKAIPVHLHAEVTYFDPNNDARNGAMFIHDETGGIYVSVPNGTTWPTETPTPGTIVDVTGVSAPGDYAAVVSRPVITVVGKANRSLEARRVTLTNLLTGVYDSEFVEIEGVVQSVYKSPASIVLVIAMHDGTITARTINDGTADYSDLVDSKVLLSGNAAALFNHERQLTGFRLMFPARSSIKIEERGPQDPFALPLTSISSLSRFHPGSSLSHMVHIRGTVTLQVPGKLLCLEDKSQALCAESQQTAPVSVGQIVDLVGFIMLGGYHPSLLNAALKLGEPGISPAATSISAQEALQGRYDTKLVQIDGRLMGYDLAAKEKTLLFSSGGLLFPVILPTHADDAQWASLKIGSKVRLTGICVVEMDAQRTSRGDGSAIITSFRLLIRSSGDLHILETPSWWTPAHSFSAFGISVVIACAILGWVVVLRRRVDKQTSRLRESEERFRHMAQHDALTGLPTRMLLHDRLQVALDRGKRFKTSLAVLMIDLDNFKQINDSFGHHAGDQTLRTTADRLLAVIRSSDTAARMGGDEFIVLLTDIADKEEAESTAARIRAELSEPITIGNHEVPVSASIGVCSVSEGAIDASMLLRRVDLAMYQAKARGRNCFEVFTGDLAADTLNKLEIQAALSHAVELEELELHYQPMISFETGQVTGFEALLRWQSRKYGLIMPNDFIPIAEESGLIVPIGEWVLREASRQMSQLEHQLGQSFLLAVNLSPRQILHPDLMPMMERVLTESKRSFASLTLEITENMLMSDVRAIRETLTKIRDLGIQVSIDDFGIGFSSLSYITRFPSDWIKIDRSIISDCTTNRGSLAVLRAIVTMAHALDISLVAEGVETEEQYILLKQEQCNVVQGYYFSKPIAFMNLPAFLASSKGTEELMPRLKMLASAENPGAPSHALQAQ